LTDTERRLESPSMGRSGRRWRGQADAMRRNGQFTKARQELRSILELRRQVNGPDSEHFKRVARAEVGAQGQTGGCRPVC